MRLIMQGTLGYPFMGRPLDPEMVASLFGATEPQRAGAILLEAARHLAGVEEVFAYRRIGERLPPETLVSCSDLVGVQQRSNLYTRKFHIDDPTTNATEVAKQGGFTRRVTAGEILRDDYRAICFEEPGFVEKLCFGWRSATDATVISFYRRKGSRRDGQHSLSALASIGLSALSQMSRSAPGELVSRIEAGMIRLFSRLSQRERQVCARTIAGWTAKQIGRALGLRPATVLTYRQRAYQRFGFRNASDFLKELLH